MTDLRIIYVNCKNEFIMENTIEKLNALRSSTPSKWRENAEKRRANRAWLRYSQIIAMKMLDRMDELKMTQKALADIMGCSQQYVSKIVRGKENLSLETIAKIETALGVKLIEISFATQPV